ncbi:MAG TPA: TMEM165/GDT1 family protein [Acidobacteriota bacterium]|nr:TMEM165/GDT1 family protein [Acidobacteriota bacterium]
MNLKVFIATFWAIFIAELADKTQLVGMSMAARTGKPISVWLGSVSAYIVVTIISVLIGTLLSKYIKPEIIRYIGGGVFIIIGLLILLNKI